MEHTVLAPAFPAVHKQHDEIPTEALNSGVSWAAVIAGAFVTAALSLILLSLGTGLGLASVSPWAHTGASASTIGWMGIFWLILMQIVAASMGGYLAGRLRTKWTRIHSDEVFFRDTAHGFLAWAVAVVMTAAFLASVAAAMAGGALQTAAVASATAESTGNPQDYFVDMMFRTTSAAANDTLAAANIAAMRAEASRIVLSDFRNGDVPQDDRNYLAHLVAMRSGIPQADAAQRVDSVIAQAKEAADRARKTASHLSLWVFMALLVGAFCASVAATIGGSQRDNVVVI